jgi:alkylhydroperoxidase family enzyme
MNYEYKQLLRHKERVKHGGGGLEATRKAATLAEFRAVVEQECPFVVADTVQDWETTEEKKKSDDTPDEY